MIDAKTINEINSELTELKLRAKKVGYKNAIPRIPKFKKTHPHNHNSTLMGFNKRINNWKKGLLILENPGGFPVVETQTLSINTIVFPEPSQN